jgi:DNA repair protein RadA/Sms
MKKQKTFIYKCSACGHEEPKWLGRCPECGEWNTLIETAASRPAGSGFGGNVRQGKGVPESLPLSSIDPQEVFGMEWGIR